MERIDEQTEEDQSVKSNCLTRFVGGLDYLFCYQWRKKMLWIFFFVIILLISMNFALTIWVYSVLQISPNHIGQIQFLKAGFEFSGTVLVMDLLRASKIYTKSNQEIVIETPNSFVLETKGNDSILENRLYLGGDRLELISNDLSFQNNESFIIFHINYDEVYLNTTELEINNDGGILLNESIEFSSLLTPYGIGLVIESPTKSIEMRTDEDVQISIHLVAPDILIPNMQININEDETRTIFSVTDYNFFVRTYQMCICENGHVFLTLPQSTCILPDASKVCG